MIIRKKEKVNIIKGYDTVEAVVSFSDALMIYSGNLTEEWILDSGCTFHMTHNKVCLQNFKSLFIRTKTTSRRQQSMCSGENKHCESQVT